jgi:hypothetical protein
LLTVTAARERRLELPRPLGHRILRFRTWVATDLTMELQDRAVLEGRLELPADGPQAEASLRDDLAVITSD